MQKKVYSGREGLRDDLRAVGCDAGIPLKRGEICSTGDAIQRYTVTHTQKGKFNRPPRGDKPDHKIMDYEFEGKLKEKIKDFREMTGRDARTIYLGTDQWNLFRKGMIDEEGGLLTSGITHWKNCEVLRVESGFHLGVGI